MIPNLCFLLILILSCGANAFLPISSGGELGRSSPALLSSTTPQDGGRVSVRVEHSIENCPYSSAEAIGVWVKQHWEKGGGLPIVIRNSSNRDGENEAESPAQGRRTILPVFVEETYDYDEDDARENESSITYVVSSPGPFFADLVPDSHRGEVTFTTKASTSSLTLTWEVEFETARFLDVYQTVTEFAIGVASRTVAESLGPCRLMSVRASLPVAASPALTATNLALREWLEFFWARGGGLFLPPPIPFGSVLEEGDGTARTSILRIPPLLVDTVLSTDTTETYAEAVYEIQNPGWTTMPFLIHTHLGRVRFLETGDSSPSDSTVRTGQSVNILWEIEIRPFPFMAPMVERLLEMTATTIVRNLLVHLKDPDARVALQPPRGKKLELGKFKVDRFGSIPKSSWLGGVLDEHRKDQRSTMDQTMSLLQPWTWGRSKDAGKPEDYIHVQWTTDDNMMTR